MKFTEKCALYYFIFDTLNYFGIEYRLPSVFFSLERHVSFLSLNSFFFLLMIPLYKVKIEIKSQQEEKKKRNRTESMVELTESQKYCISFLLQYFFVIPIFF